MSIDNKELENLRSVKKSIGDDSRKFIAKERMNMKKMTVLFVLALISAGCAQPFIKPKIENSKTFQASYDSVWKAVVEVFAEETYPIKAVEKESGIISTDFIEFPNPQNPNSEFYKLAVRPDWWASLWRSARYTVNAFVFSKEPNLTTVKVNTHIEAFEYNTSNQWHICYSTGVTEKSLLRLIDTKVK